MASGVAYTHWFTTSSGTGGQDVGTWRIVGDTFCSKWKTLRGGVESCYHHYKVGENAYESWYASDGKFSLAFRLRP